MRVARSGTSRGSRLRLACGAALLAALTAATSGCAAIKGAPEPPRPEAAAQADPAYLVAPAQLAQYKAQTDPAKRQNLRNEIIDERLLEIDHQFDAFNLELWRNETHSALAVDWTLLALTGATTVVGGVATKAALGAASTGLAGARASFDKDVLFQKSLAALMAQMVAERRKVRATIEQNKQLSDGDYTLYAAQDDLQHLIVVGSIPGVLQVIAEDAGAKSQKADDTIKSIQTGKYLRDTAGDRLRAFWKPDGKINPVNEQKIRQWMRAHGLPSGPGTVTEFMRNANMATLRSLAASDLLDH